MATDQQLEADVDLIRSRLRKYGAPPNSWDSKRLKFFDPVYHKAELMAMAQGMSREEVFDFYGVTEAMLTKYDVWFFDVHYLRGRAKAVSDAVNALMVNMKGKQGPQASLAYLNRFGAEWESNGTSDKMPRSIRIEMIE